jgi:drug/metabolite transporter (DMT)-like permease
MRLGDCRAAATVPAAMLAIALGLGSALSWGLGDFIAGLQSRRHHVLAVLAVSQVAGTAALGLLVVATGGELPGGTAALWAIGASVGGMLALLAFYSALATGTMSLVAPISASGAALPVAVGVSLGERPSAVQWAGVALAMAGVVAAAREPPHGDEERAASHRRAVALALFAAVGFGAFFLGIDRATQTADPLPATLVGRMCSVTLALASVVAMRPALPRARAAIGLILLAGLLDAGANALYALATTEGLLSVVSVLGSLYPAVTVILARLVLAERIAWWQSVGIGATLAGVGLIAAG